LQAKRRGRPKRSRLSGPQASVVVRLITSRCPDQLGLPFCLWTREAVQQLIATRCGLALSVWTVGRYLKRWGFTPQKPLKRAYEQNPRAVTQWLDTTYPTLCRQAHAEGAEIHWGDEMGLRSEHHAGRSYGLKGHTPVLPGSGQRFGCQMISSITNRGRLSFMVFTGRFNATVMLLFLGRLLRHSPRKVFLIIDRHPVHRSRKVQAWVEKHHAQLRVVWLPGYSPELNPDELLNQDVKANAVGRQRPRNQAELMRCVRTYLRSTQKYPDIVRNYFKAKHVAYAASV
jgi:transposase